MESPQTMDTDYEDWKVGDTIRHSQGEGKITRVLSPGKQWAIQINPDKDPAEVQYFRWVDRPLERTAQGFERPQAMDRESTRLFLRRSLKDNLRDYDSEGILTEAEIDQIADQCEAEGRSSYDALQECMAARKAKIIASMPPGQRDLPFEQMMGAGDLRPGLGIDALPDRAGQTDTCGCGRTATSGRCSDCGRLGFACECGDQILRPYSRGGGAICKSCDNLQDLRRHEEAWNKAKAGYFAQTMGLGLEEGDFALYGDRKSPVRLVTRGSHDGKETWKIEQIDRVGNGIQGTVYAEDLVPCSREEAEEKERSNYRMAQTMARAKDTVGARFTQCWECNREDYTRRLKLAGRELRVQLCDECAEKLAEPGQDMAQTMDQAFIVHGSSASGEPLTWEGRASDKYEAWHKAEAEWDRTKPEAYAEADTVEPVGFEEPIGMDGHDYPDSGKRKICDYVGCEQMTDAEHPANVGDPCPFCGRGTIREVSIAEQPQTMASGGGFETCPICEAGFQLSGDGRFPVHSFRGQRCEASGLTSADAKSHPDSFYNMDRGAQTMEGNDTGGSCAACGQWLNEAFPSVDGQQVYPTHDDQYGVPCEASGEPVSFFGRGSDGAVDMGRSPRTMGLDEIRDAMDGVMRSNGIQVVDKGAMTGELYGIIVPDEQTARKAADLLRQVPNIKNVEVEGFNNEGDMEWCVRAHFERGARTMAQSASRSEIEDAIRADEETLRRAEEAIDNLRSGREDPNGYRSIEAAERTADAVRQTIENKRRALATDTFPEDEVPGSYHPFRSYDRGGSAVSMAQSGPNGWEFSPGDQIVSKVDGQVAGEVISVQDAGGQQRITFRKPDGSTADAFAGWYKPAQFSRSDDAVLMARKASCPYCVKSVAMSAGILGQHNAPGGPCDGSGRRVAKLEHGGRAVLMAGWHRGVYDNPGFKVGDRVGIGNGAEGEIKRLGPPAQGAFVEVDGRGSGEWVPYEDMIARMDRGAQTMDEEWIRSGKFKVGDRVNVADENNRYPQDGTVTRADDYNIWVERDDGTTIRKSHNDATPV